MLSSIRILILSCLLVICYAANDTPKQGSGDALETIMQDPRLLRALLKSFEEYYETMTEPEPQNYYSPRMVYRNPSKRNSELLNSLLGLPKNILKSG